MARKQNQKALYEAIRQGQVRIAEGLKTGQMRSDRKRFNHLTQSGLYAASQNTAQSKQTADEEVSSGTGSGLSAKTLLIIIAVAAQVVVLGLGVWIGALYYGGGQTDENVASAAATKSQPTVPDLKRQTPTSIAVQIQEPRPIKPEAPKEPVRSQSKSLAAQADPGDGNNVIVIQGIQESRKDELLVLRDFFKKKEVPTDIIVRNGYALLVTSQGFNVNPESEGTPGYELVRKIRTLGLAYAKETGDTKFGLKPFQDCYGLLK
ncbi:MAG: hypothetical protein LLF76_12630 [Planctomycetaceae bacterium]|nr:hypothetical protein [Planctomycetaceae bacterium]